MSKVVQPDVGLWTLDIGLAVNITKGALNRTRLSQQNISSCNQPVSVVNMSINISARGVLGENGPDKPNVSHRPGSVIFHKLFIVI